MQLTSTDTRLITESLTLASLETREQMIAFLDAKPHLKGLYDTGDYFSLQSACYGVAKSNLRALAQLLSPSDDDNT